MRRIRILHVVNSFDVGGMENGVVNILNCIDSNAFEHAVCSLKGLGKAADRVTANNTVFYDLSIKQAINFRTIFIDIAKVILSFNPDIIHVRHWGPLWDTVIAHFITIRCAKLIFSFHGKTYDEYCKKNYLINFKKRLLLKFVTQILTLNQNMKDTLIREYNVSQNVEIIPNGVDTERFKPCRENDNIRDLLDLPKDCFIIGTIGRLSRIKDVDTVIKSCNSLIKKLDNVYLVVVGDGRSMQPLQQMVSRYNLDHVVRFVGNKVNVDYYLKCFDVYVQSSLYEGFSNTILEAMATGLPVVVTDVGGNISLVENNKNGFLFKPGDYNRLEYFIEKIYNSAQLKSELGNCSRVQAVRKWSIGNMIELYSEFYQRVNSP